jgi:hypothetical protein
MSAVGGHRSLNQLQVYTDDADQARLAEAAIDLVAAAFPADETGTSIYKPSDSDLQTRAQASDKK